MVSASSTTWPRPARLDSWIPVAFPIQVFPEWMRSFVSALAEETQTPVDLPALLSLSVLAACCAKRAIYVERGKRTEPLGLWVVVVLGSGSRKTPVLKRIVEPITSFERECLQAAAPGLAVERSKRRTAEERLRQVELALAKPGARDDDELRLEQVQLAEQLDSMPRIIEPRLLVEDITPESLTSVLSEQGGRIALISDEGGLFDMMAGRYSRDGLPNLDVYLKSDSASEIRVDRRGRKSEFVKAPSLTLGLTVQPEVIRILSSRPSFRGRGLLARFLYSWPVELVGRRKIEVPVVPELVETRYRSALYRLLAGGDRVSERSFEPIRLKLSDCGRRILNDFEAELEPMLGEGESLQSIADWGGKLRGKVGRIAALLHIAEAGTIDEAGQSEIDLGTVQAAITTGRYLIEHAKAAFGEMGADPTRNQARAILGWAMRNDRRTFSKRDAFHGVRGSFRRSHDLDAALELLVDLHNIREVPQDAPAGPGRPPSALYEINPQLQAQNAHNARKSNSGFSGNSALARRSLP